MLRTPLSVAPIWYVSASYCIRQKHLQTIGPAVLELISIFSVQFSFRYYQWRQCPTESLFIVDASIVNRAEKRSVASNGIVKGWKTLLLIRLLSLKNSILSMRGNTSDRASEKEMVHKSWEWEIDTLKGISNLLRFWIGVFSVAPKMVSHSLSVVFPPLYFPLAIAAVGVVAC